MPLACRISTSRQLDNGPATTIWEQREGEGEEVNHHHHHHHPGALAAVQIRRLFCKDMAGMVVGGLGLVALWDQALTFRCKKLLMSL